ncbi:MAG TPA: SIR2 family protein [Puia sp.]|uniref:SIR2 family protein n=1 Tax=Puia sp. TaxID=2045100 RepID=UPI002B7290AB|nr:SIR2 family protein [Puia sp.]HVU97979.1 SIR2 family protein [Puia sp.]
MNDRKYLFIHSARRVSVVKKEEQIEEVFINEAKPINAGDLRPPEEIAHDQKRLYYKEFFKKQFKNFLVLSGAGSSIGIGEGKGGMSMWNLWKHAEETIGKENFDALCKYVDCATDKPNLESLLSLIEGHIKFSPKKNGNEAPKDKNNLPNLEEYKETILGIIRDRCSLAAPRDETKFPHVQFLRKITQRKATLPRIKIFTLNYDLLFEQAANIIGAVVLDGFSFTTPRIFSGRYFDYDIVQREKSRLKDEDNFISRLFHLYKLHGSLNWEKEKDANGNGVDGKIVMNINAAEPLMVYPRESKYENSYEQPFFEMVARFQQNLRLDDSVLVCIGYSFGDKHINAVITEALNQNPGFQLVIVNPGFDGDNEKFQMLLKEAKGSERILMVDETFVDFTHYFPEIQTYYQEPETQPVNLS